MRNWLFLLTVTASIISLVLSYYNANDQVKKICGAEIKDAILVACGHVRRKRSVESQPTLVNFIQSSIFKNKLEQIIWNPQIQHRFKFLKEQLRRQKRNNNCTSSNLGEYCCKCGCSMNDLVDLCSDFSNVPFSPS